MICNPLSFDEQDFDQLIQPIERDLIKPFDLIIEQYVEDAIVEQTRSNHAYLGTCNEQIYRHNKKMIILLAGGLTSFGAWYAIAKISSIAMGLGIGCVGEAVRQKYLARLMLFDAESSHQKMLLMICAIEGVRAKMPSATDKRLERLNNRDIVNQGVEKFGEQDQQLGTHSDSIASNSRLTARLETNDEKKDRQIAALIADGEAKDRQLAEIRADGEAKDRQLAEIRADGEVKSRQLAEQAARLGRLENLLLAQAG